MEASGAGPGTTCSAMSMAPPPQDRGTSSEEFTEETWVTVPGAFTLALEGLRPNPATAPLSVAFTLASEAAATLELRDVAGRRIWSESVGALGAGRHVRALPVSPAPGVYWLRLAQGGHVMQGKAIVMR